MQTLAQNSYWSAKHLGDAGVEAMKVRGRMQEGMVADITIFNPDTVTDNATYKMGENGRPSSGIPYVLVSGTTMVRDSKVVDGVFPGQAIRFEPEAAGRFEPLEKKGYLEDLLAPELHIEEGIGSAATN
jgi:N-acyl-D-aspartate/D-glutamate deacylase